MQIKKPVKIAKHVLYCLEGAAFTIHLIIPMVLLVLFLSLYHGMWMS